MPEIDDRIQPFVIPSFTAVREVKRALAATRVKVGAQNMHWADAGALSNLFRMLISAARPEHALIAQDAKQTPRSPLDSPTPRADTVQHAQPRYCRALRAPHRLDTASVKTHSSEYRDHV